MRIGVIGINHKLANLELREAISKACQRCFSLGGMQDQGHVFVLLNTCNRTEIYFSSSDLPSAHSYLLYLIRCEVLDDFDQKIYSFFGQDCLHHLSRVTAGLDSAIIAETEIQGQVKAAYERAKAHVKLTSELHYLFQKALRIGKRVRYELSFQQNIPDLEHAIFSVGLHLICPLETPRILLVGASDVNIKILSFLKARQLNDITICNRSSQKAQDLAASFKIKCLDWQWIKKWHTYNWIILGTKAPYYLISDGDLPETSISHKLVIDLSVPRNVNPIIGKNSHITLLNIDQIDHMVHTKRQHMSEAIHLAEEIVISTAKRHSELFANKQMRQYAKA